MPDATQKHTGNTANSSLHSSSEDICFLNVQYLLLLHAATQADGVHRTQLQFGIPMPDIVWVQQNTIENLSDIGSVPRLMLVPRYDLIKDYGLLSLGEREPLAPQTATEAAIHRINRVYLNLIKSCLLSHGEFVTKAMFNLENDMASRISQLHIHQIEQVSSFEKPLLKIKVALSGLDKNMTETNQWTILNA